MIEKRAHYVSVSVQDMSEVVFFYAFVNICISERMWIQGKCKKLPAVTVFHSDSGTKTWIVTNTNFQGAFKVSVLCLHDFDFITFFKFGSIMLVNFSKISALEITGAAFISAFNIA